MSSIENDGNKRREILTPQRLFALIAILVAALILGALVAPSLNQSKPQEAAMVAASGPRPDHLPRPLILLRDGTILCPTDEEPASREQKEECLGGAFLARDPRKGVVVLVTARHVAERLEAPASWIGMGVDAAVLRVWPEAEYPDAASLPSLERLENAAGAEVTCSAWDLHTDRWIVADGIDSGPARRNILQRGMIPSEGAADFQGGTSGSAVYARGRKVIVGVLVGGTKNGPKEDLSFRSTSLRYEPIW